jgi:hypothetical protein
MELNPEHPVTQEMRGQWHKLLAIVMSKLGHARIELTMSDLAAFPGSACTIVCHFHAETIEIILADNAELARRIGAGQA